MELSVRFFFFEHLAHQTWQAWMKWWSKNDQVARFHAYIFAFITFGVNAAPDGRSYRGRSQRLWTMKKDLCQTFPLKCYWTMVFCCSTYPPPLVSGPLWKSYMIKLWSWFSVSIVFFSFQTIIKTMMWCCQQKNRFQTVTQPFRDVLLRHGSSFNRILLVFCNITVNICVILGLTLQRSDSGQSC